MAIDYDNVILSGASAIQAAGYGKLRMIDQGVGFKNRDTNATLTLPAAEVKSAVWFRGVRGPTMRLGITKGDKTDFVDFEALPKDSFPELQTSLKQYYDVPLEAKDFSIRGWNWGNYEFQGPNLNFVVGSKPAFELPLKNVANSTVTGKNEVLVEFTGAGNDEDAKKSRNDDLVEIRFYVPGAAKKEGAEDGAKEKPVKVKDEGEDDDEEDKDEDADADESGEELSGAQLLSDTIKDKAEISNLTTDPVFTFRDLLSLTPRARFEVALYSTFFRLRGKTQDYRINYSAIKRIFLLPKADDTQFYYFVLNLEPPIRQGQTRYPYIVFQININDEIEGEAPKLDAVEDEHRERFERLLTDLPDPSKPHYDAETFKVVAHVFAVVTGQKIITDRETSELLWDKFPREVSSFISTSQQRQKAGLKCTYKANEAFLYPLAPAGKCFLSLFKQPMTLLFRDIASITCQKVASGTGAAALRTFEIRFTMRNGPDISFGNVSRDDYPALEDFAKRNGIKVKSEMTEDARPIYEDDEEDGSEDEEAGESRKRKRNNVLEADFGGDDDEDSEEDEDFNPDAKKAKGSSDASSSDDSSGSDSDSDGSSASDSDEESPKKKEKKEKKEKKSKPEKAKKEKAPKGEGKVKKSRKKKDKNAPKRPTSSYFYFTNDKRQQVKDENPNIAFTDIGKKLGEMWKAMSPEDKKPYEDMAEKDKERYKKEMETYVPPPDTGSDDGKKTKKSSKEAKSSGKAAAAKASTSKLSEEFVKDDSSSGSGSSSSDSDSDSGSDSDSDDSE